MSPPRRGPLCQSDHKCQWMILMSLQDRAGNLTALNCIGVQSTGTRLIMPILSRHRFGNYQPAHATAARACPFRANLQHHTTTFVPAPHVRVHGSTRDSVRQHHPLVALTVQPTAATRNMALPSIGRYARAPCTHARPQPTAQRQNIM